MSKYPLIEKMGLTIQRAGDLRFSDHVVRVDDLEAALERATVVYGQENVSGGMTYSDCSEPSKSDSHQALLICVEELKREPVKFVQDMVPQRMDEPYLYFDVPKEMAGKCVRVTVEELP